MSMTNKITNTVNGEQGERTGPAGTLGEGTHFSPAVSSSQAKRPPSSELASKHDTARPGGRNSFTSVCLLLYFSAPRAR
jgi:hypothetical protein